ncbi:hypothetical protein TWF730_002939 [Orbilia blumenaviensis]|uniref:Uncharacterized protein n=1 Tax=Orbilia blumenaviensis TaxID=1796055 RepID=A0AAV9U7D2_9PEZI
MKFFSILAIAVLPLAFASPIEVPEALQKRACNNYNAVSACSNACKSYSSSACTTMCKNATSPSCHAQCYSSRLNSCKNCCAARCTMC